jgi:hypothetical protein
MRGWDRKPLLRFTDGAGVDMNWKYAIGIPKKSIVASSK